MMYSEIKFRTGNDEVLVTEFVEMANMGRMRLKRDNLENPDMLVEENILAVHYSDGGAQGDAGVVEILYCMQHDVKILYGNYVYGILDLDAVIRKLPMLQCLDSRYRLEPPYPFGGKLDIPEGWGYLYMGAMNHFFAKQVICDKTSEFIKILLNQGGRSWQVFDAIAWLCGTQYAF